MEKINAYNGLIPVLAGVSAVLCGAAVWVYAGSEDPDRYAAVALNPVEGGVVVSLVGLLP